MKKICAFVLAVALIFTLTGCGSVMFESDSMLRPPKTSGDAQEISEALQSAVGRQPLFRYPRSGEHRSAITMKDLDNDGVDEAIVFYAPTSESTVARIAVLTYVRGNWKVTSTAEGLGNNVDILLFGNLLPEHEGSEIIVGWSVSTNSGLLTAYSYTREGLTAVSIEDSANAENSSAAGYTGVAVCDMDGDSADEIMTATLNTVAGTSVVRMLKYLSGEGAERLFVAGMCSLDGTVTRYSKVTAGMLDDTTQAFIIDSYKGTDRMYTEAVCWDKLNAGLKTPFNSGEESIVSGTDREAVIDSFDVDVDGLTEIPKHVPLPCYTEKSEQKFYKTSWYSYDSQVGTVSQQSEIETVLNTTDGYYLTLPPSWPTDITVRYDAIYSTMSFCVAEISYEQVTVSASDLTGDETVVETDYDADSAVIIRRVESYGGELFRIRVFDKEMEELIPAYGYETLREQNNRIWALQIYALGEQYGITYNVINTCLYLL